MEIYSPPYLFRGPRPEVVSAPEAVASRLVAHGESVDVDVPSWVRAIEEEIDPVRILFAHDLAVWERTGDVLGPAP